MKVEEVQSSLCDDLIFGALLPAMKGPPKVIWPLRGKLPFRSCEFVDRFACRNRTIENCSRFALTGGRDVRVPSYELHASLMVPSIGINERRGITFAR
jgi:hypothetical protein